MKQKFKQIKEKEESFNFKIKPSDIDGDYFIEINGKQCMAFFAYDNGKSSIVMDNRKLDELGITLKTNWDLN